MTAASAKSNLQHPVRAKGPRWNMAVVSFTTVNGADPTINYAYGVATVVRSSEGVHTITLDSVGVPALHVNASFKGAATGDLMQLGTKTASASTVVINTYAAGSPPTLDDCPGAIVDVTIYYPESK